MAGLEDLYAQIPTSEIASKLGADQGEVDNAYAADGPAWSTHTETDNPPPPAAEAAEETAADEPVEEAGRLR
jgi:hypothetical protein